MNGGRPATVLALCDYGGPYAGSFVPMLRATAAAAARRGLRFACGFSSITQGRGWLADLDADGIEYRIAPGDDRAALSDWVGAWLAELPGPALIHTHFTGFELAALRAAGDAPVVWHAHTHLPKSPRMVARAVVKYGWYGRRVAAIICVSDAIAAAVRRRGAPRAAVSVVPNGVDTDRFAPIGATERADARALLELPADAPVLLHIGWDWELKGGPLFAQALAALRATGVDAIGLTVGGGAPARAAAEELGLGSALMAVEPTDDVRRLYAAADALVATSLGEGAPFAVLESLSCGLTVVATDVPGHRLGATPPAALHLASPAPERLADAIASAIADRDAASAQAAHGWVVDNRSVAVNAEGVVRVYERVLGG